MPKPRKGRATILKPCKLCFKLVPQTNLYLSCDSVVVKLANCFVLGTFLFEGVNTFNTLTPVLS